METIIRIKTDDLTPDFLQKIKTLFKNEVALEISITPVSDFGLAKKETPEEYKKRVNEAIGNLEGKNDTIGFSGSEFESLTIDLLSAK
jgi:hypothetical protein